MNEHGSSKITSCLDGTFSDSVLVLGSSTRNGMSLMKETEIVLECLTDKDAIVRTEVFEGKT